MEIDRELEDETLWHCTQKRTDCCLNEKMMGELDSEALKKASLTKDPCEVIAMGLILGQKWNPISVFNQDPVLPDALALDSFAQILRRCPHQYVYQKRD